MVTFLLDLAARRGVAGRPRELVGPRARHPGVPGAHPGVEALPPRAVADHRVPEVAGARQRAEPRLREGAGRARDASRISGSKTVLDAFTCVECGRCQVNCPAWGAGKALNPEDAHPADAGRAARRASATRSSARSTARRCCGSARPAAPARTSARSASSTCRSSSARGAAWCRTATRRTTWAPCTTTSSGAANIWGLGYDQRQKFVESAALEIFDPARHDVLVWLGCAGAFEADFQKSLRSLFEILRARRRPLRRAVEGALHGRRRRSAPATSTCSRSWRTANIEDLKAAGAEEDPRRRARTA